MMPFDNARMLCARSGSVNSISLWQPLCSLCLCGLYYPIHHRDTENTEVAQRSSSAFDYCRPLPHTARRSILSPPDAFPKIALINSFLRLGRRPDRFLPFSPHGNGRSLSVAALRARAGPQGQKGDSALARIPPAKWRIRSRNSTHKLVQL